MRKRRRARHAGRRVDPAARRRHRARRPPRHRQEPRRTRAASCARASAAPTIRSPTATRRRRRSSARTSPLYAVRRVRRGPHRPAVGHEAPEGRRRRGGPSGRPKSDKPKEPPLVVSGGIKGGDELVGQARDPRHPRRQGPRDRLRLRPDPPLPDGVGLPAGLERDPQLERPAARAAPVSPSAAARARDGPATASAR